MTWTYLLYSQFPAFFLLAVFFLVSFFRVRKNSLVKSTLWVLLFAAAFAALLLFACLGVHQKYWTFRTMFPLKAASWIGIVLVLAAVIAHVVHLIEKKHNRKVMEKELRKAERDKEEAVAQAQEEGREAARQALEEGRRTAHQEAAAERFTQAAGAAEAEAAGSELAQAAQSPIELTLDAPADAAFPAEPPAFDPMTGAPLPVEPPAFDPMTGGPLAAPPGENGTP